MIVVECVYSLKSRGRFNSRAKCMYSSSFDRFATLLLGLRTSTVATASRKVTMIAFSLNLPLIIVFNMKSSSFSIV